MKSYSRALHFLTVRLALGLMLFAAAGSVCLAQSAPIESLTHFPRTTLDIVAHGFCIAPANDLGGNRRILVTTFDFAGRADFNNG